MFTDFSPTLQLILTQMCSYVPVDPHIVDWKNDKDPYYSKYHISKHNQELFRAWLMSFLKSRKHMKVMGFFHTNKLIRAKVTDFFIACYGFSVRGE